MNSAVCRPYQNGCKGKELKPSYKVRFAVSARLLGRDGEGWGGSKFWHSQSFGPTFQMQPDLDCQLFPWQWGTDAECTTLYIGGRGDSRCAKIKHCTSSTRRVFSLSSCRFVRLQSTWQALEAVVDEGLVKHIGVSNISVKKFEDLLTYNRHPVVINQVEIHPYW